MSLGSASRARLLCCYECGKRQRLCIPIGRPLPTWKYDEDDMAEWQVDGRPERTFFLCGCSRTIDGVPASNSEWKVAETDEHGILSCVYTILYDPEPPLVSYK